MVGVTGQPVAVTERGGVTCEPARFHTGESPGWQPVEAWAGPWPVDEQWWEASTGSTTGESPEVSTGSTTGRRPVARFQVVGADGSAWLMRCDGDTWWTEASYE
jgi:protein ImuB